MLNKLKNLGLTGLVSLNFFGCGPLIPEGDKVKTYADGIISVEEEDQIRLEFESINGIDGFNPIVQNFVNDVDVYLKNEFSRKGFELRGITEDLHIYMPQDEVELAQKYKEVCLKDKPKNSSAFYGPNNTIYIPKTSNFILDDTIMPYNITLGDFYSTFFHELGHHSRYDPEEYYSEAFEYYASLKLYALNKKLGLQVLTNSLCFLPKKDADDYFEKYDYGCVNFIIQANKFDGNLETSFNHILTTPQLHMKSYLKDVLDQYSTMSYAYLFEFEKLLFSNGFKKSFDKLNDNEFFEMRDFFRAYVYYITSRWDEVEGYEYSYNLVKAREYSEEFLEKYENPYFRGKLIYWLSNHYSSVKEEVLNEIKEVRYSEREIDVIRLKELLVENYDLNNKIIGMNKEYPCEYRFSECTKIMAVKRINHMSAYFDILRFNFFYTEMDINQDELINKGIEFVDKFYPRKDFAYEHNDLSLAYMGLYVNYYTGILLRDKLKFIDNPIEYNETCELAKQFFEYVKLGSCAYVSSEKKEECKLVFGADPYTVAEKEQDNLGACFPINQP
ncbi:MAG: hypothetical protein KKB39_04905 [Nanoarchaeota archaeon]|nr:hypothetical protein [Nanoarchaeota archaeon]